MIMIIELLLLSLSLAADAFSVSLCRGLKMRKFNLSHALIIGAFFGGFQTIMPVLGWLAGSAFAQYIEKYDHFVAFALLALIGGKMIYNGIKGEEDKSAECGEKLDIKELFIMAIATSIDAFAVGITIAMEGSNIWLSASVIGVVTFGLSVAGVFIGNRFGAKYKDKATLAGGIILVLLGLKIMLSGIGVLPF